MKAIVQGGYGPPMDVLRLEDVPDPVAEPGKVLVKVEVAGVNAADWHLVTGMPYVMRSAGLGLRRPKEPIPGLDLAGQVEAVGAGVTRFRPGDQVFGSASRAFAELVDVPEERLAPVPPGVTLVAAAATPIAAVTALQGLRQGHNGPGRRVLVTGASGGVGTFAVQMAASRSAHVTAVCSNRNIDLVRRLGADEVIDYTVRDPATWVGPYELILHLAGPLPVAVARRVLASDGTVVLSSGDGGPWWGPLPRMATAMAAGVITRTAFRILTARMNREDLEAVAGLLASGTVQPVIDRTYSLAQAAAAVQYLRAGHTRGKVVITVR
jgi:NADPH:quinone reductase-like Zn-dependent oxidoreductase